MLLFTKVSSGTLRRPKQQCRNPMFNRLTQACQVCQVCLTKATRNSG